MSALEETWVVARDGDLAQVGDEDGFVIVDISKDGALNFGERADLIAAAPELYRALKSIEWTVTPFADYGYSCRSCEGSKEFGHAAGCIIDAALKKARGEQ